MKEIYINDLSSMTNKSSITSQFLVVDKSISKMKSGKEYIIVKLMDKDGKVGGRIWDNVSDLDSRFNVSDYVELTAEIDIYKGEIQLSIKQIRSIPKVSISLGDFIPMAPINIDVTFSRMMGIIDNLANPFLRELIKKIFEEDVTKERFKMATAAKSNHHAYSGGLLQHTMSMVDLAISLSVHYDGINRDLLVAG